MEHNPLISLKDFTEITHSDIKYDGEYEYVKLIDYNVDIPFKDKLPKDYLELLEEAEQWDNEENYLMYMECVKSIDVGAKLLCMNGIINSNQWETLNKRYKWW